MSDILIIAGFFLIIGFCLGFLLHTYLAIREMDRMFSRVFGGE